jgi:membrane protease YdiL (CAAX protease family)
VTQYDWKILLIVLLPIAVLLGYARTNTGSIWPPLALHIANNILTVLFTA